MSEAIVNKVSESTLVTIDLEEFLPKVKPEVFDLKGYLFKEQILKEKDFREALEQINWEQYKGKTVLIICSVDAVIPVWAYMLIATNLTQHSNNVFMETEAAWQTKELINNIGNINTEDFLEKRIVIKGCGEKEIPAEAYFEITKKLQPVAKSIMYGEPCSTVPVYKKSKTKN